METAHLRRRIAYLCSEVCAGREAGSPEGLAARRFIRGELEAAGLTVETQKVPGCRGANLIAHLGDPEAAPAVLIGAHYDHIGRAWEGEAYWGADDNAAAVAILCGLADQLTAAPPAGPIVFAAFDGEEPPHFLTEEMGAIRYCAEPTVPLDRIDLAIVLDLVGHAVGPEAAPRSVRSSLFCLGGEKSDGTGALVAAAAAAAPGLSVRPLDLDVVPPLSDYEPFRRRGVPVLFLTCGRWQHYHEVTDTPDRLDYDKIAATGEFVRELVVRASANPGRGRYRADARDLAGTIDTLQQLARELSDLSPSAGAAVDTLEVLRGELAQDERPTPSAWSTLLQIVALMEQGLA